MEIDFIALISMKYPTTSPIIIMIPRPKKNKGMVERPGLLLGGAGDLTSIFCSFSITKYLKNKLIAFMQEIV